MYGINWVDLLIVSLVAGGIVLAVWVGFLKQLCVIVCFFGAMFLGGWIFPYLLPIHDRTLLTIVNGNLVLIVAAYLGIRGLDLGRYLNLSLAKGRLHLIEIGASVLAATASILIFSWLAAAALGRLPFVGLSNSVNDSLIVQVLDRHLPAVPAVFAEFDRLINPNSSPHLIVHYEAQTSASTGSLPSGLRAAAQAGGDSTVRITGFGCGGVVSGSGFVAAPDVVLTNAHVIAGVKRPIIKYNNRSYEGVPVAFNPNLDFAALRVNGLPAKPLTLATSDTKIGTTVAVLGYPGGDYAIASGIIRDDFQIFGQNIYGEGLVGRNVYELQTTVAAGSSGGPIVLPDGQIAGILFAKSDSTPDDAFALTSSSLLKPLARAEKSTLRTGTGACMVNQAL